MTDTCHAQWDRDVCQITVGKCPISDADNTVSDGISSPSEGNPGLADRVFDEFGLSVVIQYPCHTAIRGIVGIHVDSGQGVAVKRLESDIRNTMRDRDAG